MTPNPFEPLATTVLREGQVLYPYRASALKNQHPFTFGTLACGESCALEILVECGSEPTAEAELHFLRADTPASIALAPRFVPLAPGLWKMSVRATAAETLGSAQIRCRALNGAFISAQDPGPAYAEAAAACRCQGLYPVLVGAPPRRDLLLAAPIVLEDYPRIADQSPGDFCDSTEMDELLTLRILTLSDAEKAEIRAAGGLPAQILARSEASTPGTLASLHGARVRLHPRPGPDLFNRLLDGKEAIVQEIASDMEGNLHLAVVLPDDPGRDLGELRQVGHRFFFTPAEVEPL